MSLSPGTPETSPPCPRTEDMDPGRVLHCEPSGSVRKVRALSNYELLFCQRGKDTRVMGQTLLCGLATHLEVVSVSMPFATRHRRGLIERTV